jgi:hypothetical protein
MESFVNVMGRQNNTVLGKENSLNFVVYFPMDLENVARELQTGLVRYRTFNLTIGYQPSVLVDALPDGNRKGKESFRMITSHTEVLA